MIYISIFLVGFLFGAAVMSIVQIREVDDDSNV